MVARNHPTRAAKGKAPVKQTVRTFVAVPTSPTVRQWAAELTRELSTAGADVKWVEMHNLHLTLKFLGDVKLKETAGVCEAVEAAAAEVAPFDFQVRGAGAFPNAGRPGTVWLGTGEGEEEMAALFHAIESALAKLGFRKEHRRFQPHLTIGRVRRGGPGVGELGQLIRQHADFEAGRMTVSEVIVFSSHLDRSGPTYETLGRATLGGT